METNSRRVSLVTGGTDGIGRAVALELARGGDRVLFVGRDARRGTDVLHELEAAGPGLDHAFLTADLSLLGETARLAELVAQRTCRLDAAVFCAGVLSTVPEWTPEGLERNFVLNYLSRYLLARRLLPVLTAAPSGRLVLVANAAQYPDTLDFGDLQHRKGKPGLSVAGRTQVANDLFALELSERVRETRLEVTCVYPGHVRTSVFRNARIPWFMRLLVPLLQLGALTPAEGAETPVFLAQSPLAAGTSGLFYGPHKQLIPVPERVRRPDRRRVLWEASHRLVEAHLARSPEAFHAGGAALEVRSG